MYLFKQELKEEVLSKYKIKYFADKIGITAIQMSRIINCKSKTSKAVAYLFTKLVDNTKEIEDYFVRKEK